MQYGHVSLTGLRVGFIRRQSTPRQIGNYSTLAQAGDFPAWLEQQGAIPVAFDEGAISGRDLSKRAVARQLLDLIRDGEVGAFGAADIDRVSRDPLGIDPGVIADVLRQARAPLVTYRRTYNLRDKDDLFQYKLDTGLAAREGQQITERMWRGVFTKAEREPFFMGNPPVGYTTALVEVPGDGPNGRTRIKRVPQRDEELVDMMHGLAEALDVSATSAEVAARMNDVGHGIPVQRGKRQDTTCLWNADRVMAVVTNPLYCGQWVPFRHSDRQAEIWDASYAYGDRRSQRIVKECSHLAWYTSAQMATWRDKLIPAPGQPKRRYRRHERPLRGILACVHCGRPMTAAGSNGYSCASGQRAKRGGGCATPQMLTEAPVLRVLRDELPAAIRQRADREAVLRATLTETPHLDGPRSELGTLRAQVEQMVGTWYPPGRVIDVPDAIVRVLAERNDRIRTLEREISLAEQAAQTADQTEQLVTALLTDPLAAFDRLPVGRQADILRRVFVDVRIETTGHGGGRKYRILPGYTNRLITEVSAGEANTDLEYLGTHLAVPAA